MTIAEILKHSTTQLNSISPSARLDCELLLSYVLKQPKLFLYTDPDYQLSISEEELFQQLLKQRQQGKPIAQLIGKQAFWSFELTVTPDVLIPRPETEMLVEQVLKLLPADKACKVADLGTGSGAIAIALALERPLWQITAVDISSKALAVAKENAEKLGVNSIDFQYGNWCENLTETSYDCIVSNPPYIAVDDPALEQMVKQYEPESALISGRTGLECIEILASEAKSYLVPGGYLVLEHGYQQYQSVKSLLQQEGYSNIEVCTDYAGHLRVTAAIFLDKIRS